MNKSDAFWEGYNAYLNHSSISDNPYNTHNEVVMHDDWKNGWYEAAWDD